MRSALIFYYSVDQGILKHMMDTQAEFLMEVTDKTKADIKVTICVLFGITYTQLLIIYRVVLSLIMRAASVSLRLPRFLPSTSRTSKPVS